MKEKLFTLIAVMHLMSSTPSFAVFSYPSWMEECEADCSETFDKAIIFGAVSFTYILTRVFAYAIHSQVKNKDIILDLSNPDQHNIKDEAYVKFECSSDQVSSSVMKKFERKYRFFHAKLDLPLNLYKSCKASLMIRAHSVPLCFIEDTYLTDDCSSS